nr:RNA-directed DNA polymerase, eukaryota, reverse transcriptase zinc-binding domain protein [Tanacetum cinerariifolium]
TNGLIRFNKKLQDLKKIIRSWIKDKKCQQSGAINSIKEDLIDIDKNLDSGNVFDDILLKRMELTQKLHDINQMEARDYVQKSKIKWAIEGDENSKFFHALIPEVTDAKFVTDFRPISLIGCVYKVVMKILANCLATVISDLVSDIQSAFVANRQI